MKKIAFIGLGIMGFSIAAHLLKKNKKITIFNRTIKKSLSFKKNFNDFEVSIADSPLDAAKNKDYIFSCVGDDNDLDNIFFSKHGVINSVSPDTNIIDHTTCSDSFSKFSFKEFKKKKCNFLDAPVSGGESGAKEGNLSIMVGGEKKIFNELAKTFKLYSRSCVYMGSSGNGQLAKMVNQICIAGLLQGLSEGLNFGKKKGLNFYDLNKAISTGAAQSWQMDNRANTMWNDKFNFGFMNKLMYKDLNILKYSADKDNIKIPITKQVLKLYKELIKNKFEKYDTSSLIKLLK